MTSELGDHAGAFGKALAGAAARRHSQRRRTRRIVLTATVAVVTGTALIALPQLRETAAPLDVVAAAEAAVTPDGGIEHYAVRFSGGMADANGKVSEDDTPARCRESFRHESWISSEPVRRWRLDQPATPCSTRIDGLGNATDGRHTMAFDGSVSWSYAPDDRWATVFTDVPEATRRPPTLPGFELPGMPPAATTLPQALRAMLASGRLHDTGRPAYGVPNSRLLRGSWASSEERRATELTTRTTIDYVVNANTFVPVSVRSFSRRTRADQKRTSRTYAVVTTVDFTVYEHLPSSAELDALFAPRFASGTRVQRMPFADYMRRAKARHAEEDRQGRAQRKAAQAAQRSSRR